MSVNRSSGQPSEDGFQGKRNRGEGNQPLLQDATEGQGRGELQKFIEFHDDAADGNGLIDREGYIIYANKAVCSWMGYSQEDFRRLHLSDVNLDYDEADYQLLFEQAYQKSLAPFETVLIRKDGTAFPIEVSLKVVHFDGKSLLLAIARDITLRKQVEEQQERYLRYTSLRADISQALAQQSSLQLMLQLCCEAMVSHLHVSSTRIWTLNDEEQVLELQASAGSTTYHLGIQDRIAIETAKMTPLVREKQPYLINDVLTDPRINDKAWTTQEGIVAIASYPLILDEQIVGIMTLFAQKRFTEETFDLLTLIASAIAQGIGRKWATERLEQQVEQRTRELSLLLQISQTLASTLEREPLMSTILAQLKDIIDYDSAILYEIKEDQSIPLTYQSVLPAHITERLTQIFRLHPYYWQIIQQRKVTIIDDVGALEAFTRKIEQEMGAYSEQILALYRSWMAVPLVTNERPLGILTIGHHTPNFYKPHHADLVFALANQAALALENMFLYEQAQALAALQERQRLARELHDSVSQDFYGVGLNAQIAYEALETDPGEVRSALEQIIELAETGRAETRALLLELKPEVLETEGLIAALQRQVTILRKRYRLQVDASLSLQTTLPFEEELTIYRIAQESLNNVVKHAQAETVTLRMAQEGQELVLEVRDNGKGFDVTKSLSGGIGLQLMQDRVGHLQGTLTINSIIGQGTSLSVHIPTISSET